ncbi:hypothetical protein HHS34_009170 [Acidithiobacillus montserratensis]|uniref:Uncharacterized protein n=1 Tax=Acidithiobacillus montserratensis TaxID=2729135 RepID=A0ACD5HCU2_9PROT|nr:hypothetical protein [Acidithiobacillus montserratensis]MBU2748196.1 hypothetical protein [Acidithiobacillus montserratensis]
MKNRSPKLTLLMFSIIALAGCAIGPTHHDVRQALRNLYMRNASSQIDHLNISKEQVQHIDHQVRETRVQSCRKLHGMVYRCSLVLNGQIQIIDLDKIGSHWEVETDRLS